MQPKFNLNFVFKYLYFQRYIKQNTRVLKNISYNFIMTGIQLAQQKKVRKNVLIEGILKKSKKEKIKTRLHLKDLQLVRPSPHHQILLAFYHVLLFFI